MISRLLPLAVLAVALTASASAQHDHSAPTADGDPHTVSDTFVVTGFRIEDTDPPPGSGVGRAGLRYGDGGYVHVVHGKPYARGRTIWGGLVGFDMPWAAGAHQATELVTTVPLMVGETRIEPGVYSLFLTPRHNAWTLHVNTTLGMHLADEYDAANDVASVIVAPTGLQTIEEGLTWSFRDDGAFLTLAWGNLAGSFPISRADA
ncbi:MAG: DUF2911 domain-containing protein [Bacteroidota bacterium]